MNDDSKKKPRRFFHLEGVTNFYPKYDSTKDRVFPVHQITPPIFQSIIPHYQLSMSETRDMGTGPTFLEVEYPGPAYRRIRAGEKREIQANAKQRTNRFSIPRHKHRKIRLDFWS